MGTEHEPRKDEDNYSFMQESIKDEALNPKRVLRVVGLGLIFGVAACVSFFALKPWAESVFQRQPSKVEIPVDDDKEKDEAVVEGDDSADDTAQPDVPVDKELTMEDYLQLNEALADVAAEIEKSLVYVHGIGQGESWGDIRSNKIIEGSHYTSGIIVADNGRELLILANYSSMKQEQLFRVTFADQTEHEAVLKQKDGKSDLAIYSVAKNGISESTMNRIKIVSMGNSNVVKQGEGLIAFGSPFGLVDGLSYGAASTVGVQVARADGKCGVIVTDMPWAENASGGLFDFKGSLVGMIDQSLAEKESLQTLAAIGISSIKKEVELMSNGKNVPYVGVIGITITKEMSETHGIPEGLFVESVEADSPAMKAGIQSGDVITSAAGTKVDSFTAYYDAIIGQEPGKQIKINGQRQGAESYVDIKFDVTVGIKE